MINFNEFFIIAGPCVIWNKEHLLNVAGVIQDITGKMGVQWVLKASYDKANRSKIDSFRGPGFDDGLNILSWIKYHLGCLVTSDVHEARDVATAAEVLDIIQIPAFLCRQTDLLVAAGKCGRPVNVKKGQFISPAHILDIMYKLNFHGLIDCLITERGSQFGYSDVVVDFRTFRGMLGCKGHYMVLDVTHTVPSWHDSIDLAKAGAAVGVNGIFVEVGSKGCDENRSLPITELENFLNEVLNIHYAVQRKKASEA